MTTLDLSNRRFNKLTVNNLPKLTALKISGSQIKNLSLDSLPQLTTLDLSGSNSVDLSQVKSFTKLQKLDISGCCASPTFFSRLFAWTKASPIATLKELKSLTQLTLSENQFSESQLEEVVRSWGERKDELKVFINNDLTTTLTLSGGKVTVKHPQ